MDFLGSTKHIALLGLVLSCSSPEKIDVSSSSGGSVVSTSNIYRRDESAVLQNAVLGTLPFFYGGARGLNVNSIKWNEPVAAENPGVDCDLNYTEGSGASHFFRCIVKEGNSHIIVSLQEDLLEGRRMLRRIFMDGKGESLINQWSAALERVGYRKVKNQGSGVRATFLSSRSGTIAEIIWVSSSESATLRISPKL
jgi:hypothetical protein